MTIAEKVLKSVESKPAQAPISAHPLFGPLVALWFATLFGMGSFVLPSSLYESILGAPIGLGKRLLITLVAAAVGAALGLWGARKVTLRAMNRHDPERTRGITERGARAKAARQPLFVNDEMDDDPLPRPASAAPTLEAMSADLQPRRRRPLTGQQANAAPAADEDDQPLIMTPRPHMRAPEPFPPEPAAETAIAETPGSNRLTADAINPDLQDHDEPVLPHALPLATPEPPGDVWSRAKAQAEENTHNAPAPFAIRMPDVPAPGEPAAHALKLRPVQETAAQDPIIAEALAPEPMITEPVAAAAPEIRQEPTPEQPSPIMEQHSPEAEPARPAMAKPSITTDSLSPHTTKPIVLPLRGPANFARPEHRQSATSWSMPSSTLSAPCLAPDAAVSVLAEQTEKQTVHTHSTPHATFVPSGTPIPTPAATMAAESDEVPALEQAPAPEQPLPVEPAPAPFATPELFRKPLQSATDAETAFPPAHVPPMPAPVAAVAPEVEPAEAEPAKAEVARPEAMQAPQAPTAKPLFVHPIHLPYTERAVDQLSIVELVERLAHAIYDPHAQSHGSTLASVYAAAQQHSAAPAAFVTRAPMATQPPAPVAMPVAPVINAAPEAPAEAPFISTFRPLPAFDQSAPEPQDAFQEEAAMEAVSAPEPQAQPVQSAPIRREAAVTDIAEERRNRAGQPASSTEQALRAALASLQRSSGNSA